MLTRLILAAGAIATIVIATGILLADSHWGWSMQTKHESEAAEADSWLIATMSHYDGQAARRRFQIRETWQALYADAARATCRFVLSRAHDADALQLVLAENRTFGDIVVLDWLPENRRVANSVKTIEFFRSLNPVLNGSNSHLRRSFVSKADDDSFIFATKFRDMFLSPNVGIDRLVVGRNCSGCKSYLYAAGQFYTMSLPMIDHLSELYYRNPPTKYVEEDALNGLLLLSNHETSPVNYTFVHVANEYAFDWDPDSNDTSANNHQVGVESLNPHKMKRDKDYLHVSGMFGKHGIIPDRLNNVKPI